MHNSTLNDSLLNTTDLRPDQPYLPACWNDELRMTALFAPPRSVKSNPQDWESKFNFWKKCILNWCEIERKLTFTPLQVKAAFTRNGKTPAALLQVLESMTQHGDLIPMAQFKSQLETVTWTRWATSLAFKPLTWSFTKVKQALVEVQTEICESFLVPHVLRSKMDELKLLATQLAGQVLESSELIDSYPSLFGPEEEEADLLLQHAAKAGLVVLDAQHEHRMIVKFPGKEEKMATEKTPRKEAKINASDRGLAHLKHSQKLLEKELRGLEEECQNLQEMARLKLKEGLRPAAKIALHRKKGLEQLIEKRQKALLNLQNMELQLRQANTDNLVMNAYQAGLAALQESFKDLPLSADGVEDTLIKLEEVLEKHDDIRAALAGPIASDGDVSEAELEDELAQLLEEEKEEEEAAKSALNQSVDYDAFLPSPPTHLPASPIAERLKKLRE